MRTNRVLYAVTFFVITALIIGCSKERPDDSTANQYSPVADMKIGKVVESFKLRLDSKLKTTDTIPSDSVEWYLCAALNYTYGDATAKGPNQLIDSAFVSIQINNNYAQMDDVRDLYSSIIDSISEPFYSINDNDKHLIVVIVTSTRVTSDQINYKVTSIFQYGSYSGLAISFGPNDSWKWWNMCVNNGGYCAGLYQGTHLESDAAIEIQKKIFIRKGVPIEYYCYLPPFTSVEIWPGDYPNPNYQGNYNHLHYYLYQNCDAYPDFDGCLDQSEMNFYLTGTEHVIYTANDDPTDPGARPAALSFITFNEFTGDQYYLSNDNYYMHHGEVKYGLLVFTGNAPDNL